MRLFISILIIVAALNSFAQQPATYNHYYLNPYVYNPAYAGASGYGQITASNSMQWTGPDKTFSTSYLTAELPLKKNITIAGRFYSDREGLLYSCSAALTFVYGVKLANDQRISFGLSGGGQKRSLSKTRLNVADGDDLTIADYNSSGADGNFGITYQVKQLTLGFALPSLITPAGVDGEKSNSNLSNYLLSASYRIKSDILTVEPQLLYNSNTQFAGHFEGMLTCYYKDAFWAGGLYKTQYGPSVYCGFRINSAFKAGYAYQTGTGKTQGAINGIHEILISYQFGQKQQ